MPARLTDQERILRDTTEHHWQKIVTQIMDTYGWTWWHAPDNRPGRNGRVQNVRPGLPDLIAVRGKRLIFAELKRETGRTTPEQDDALAKLGETHAETYVWRPRDREEVLRVLAPNWS